jgi:uncharacterized protein YmfQ (DUF2313 family)
MGLPTWGVTDYTWGANSFVWGAGADPTDPRAGLVPFSILDAPSVEETLQQISQHLPQGRAWGNKLVDGSNTYALLRSCAVAFNLIQEKIEELAREFNINLTEELLPEWETSVGLPDDCVQELNTLQEQRENVIFRLRKVPIVTKAEFEELGTALAGTTVTVTPGDEVDMTGTTESRFKLYVSFPVASTGFEYDFDVGPPAGFPLGGFRNDLVFCVFNKIVPASVVVLEN